MAEQKYSYSISNDFLNGIIDSARLADEIRFQAIVVALDRIDTEGDDCNIWFRDSLDTNDLALLDATVASHTGEPQEPENLSVEIKNVDIDGKSHIGVESYGFVDKTGYNIFIPGYRRVATAGQATQFDISYTSNMKLQGMQFRVDGNPVDGDVVDVEIVDVDGIVYPAGTTLVKFADDINVWPEREFKVICDDAKTVYSWMYIRVTYVSNGSSDVVVYFEHYLRTIPQ